MATVSFDDLMKGFGVVTVMNACIFVPKKAYVGNGNCKDAINPDTGKPSFGLSPEDFVPAYEYIDTLKIANFTPEGPTKSVTGGQYANTLIKYGKTMTAEIQDALGRASTMVRFFGADYDGLYTFTGDGVTTEFNVPGVTTGAANILVRMNGVEQSSEADSGTITLGEDKITFKTAPEAGAYITVTKPGSRISITDKFPGPFAIEGDTFFIDQKTGEKKYVFIFIPQFYPDAILTLTQDAEGDATVFDLNGTVAVTDVKDSTDSPTRSIFYEVRDTSFFAAQRAAMVIPGEGA